MSSKSSERKQKQSKSKEAPKVDKVIAIGASVIALATAAGLYKVHEAVAESKPKPMSEMTYHADKDHTVYGFAARHLKGDPRQYLAELRAQLPKEAQDTYNVPDDFVFKVESEDIAKPNSVEIGSAAYSNEASDKSSQNDG